MKKRFSVFKIIFFCLLLWNGLVSVAFSQVAYAPEVMKGASDMMKDDPIVAALDSLYKLDLFEMGYAKVNYPINPKYNFSIDSVPRYDDMVYESRVAKLNALSPFDLEYNTFVQTYINMYIFNRREQVSRMMALSQLYFPMFEELLDKYNLPLEFKYLAMVESALNPMAKSRSGAMGLWQFMYPTGKMYGLKVSSYVDERCDPYKSTVAACEYFQYLYGMFNDWEMVLAAYNGGPGTVNKAIRRSGGKKTYWGIRPFLPKETQGYIPAFIAVNYVMSYTSEHNIHSSIPKKTFLDVDTVSVKKQLSFEQVSSLLNIPEDELQYLNPSYRKRVIPVSPGETSFITLPSNKIGAFINNETLIYNYQKSDTVNMEGMAVQEVTETHTILPGEHLSTIAKKYGCSVEDIKTWNKIKSNTVKPGKKLTIYTYALRPVEKKTGEKPARTETARPATSAGLAAAHAVPPAGKTLPPPGNDSTIVTKTTENDESDESDVNDVNKNTNDDFLFYTIKKGDSLSKIAVKNKTTIDKLKKLNNFGAEYQLVPGKTIKIAVL